MTRRAQVERLSRESEERFRSAFACAAVGMALTDMAGRFISANPAYCAITGYSEAELGAIAFPSITHPDDLPANMEKNRRLLAGEIPGFVIEKRYIRKDGSIIWVKNSVSLVRDDRGNPVNQLALVENITERKLAEDALRLSEARFRTFTGLSTDWYWEQDEQLRFTKITGSSGTAPYHGFQDNIGKTRWELPIHNVTLQQWEEHKRTLSERRVFRDFVVEYRHDDKVSFLSISGAPVFDPAGRFAGYRGTAKDITRQKLAEKALQESEERFRSLTALSSDWYWEQDANHRFTMVSGGTRAGHGFDADACVGKTRWEHGYYVATAEQWNAHKAMLDRHEPFRNAIFEMRRDDGKTGYVSISGEPIFDESGRFNGYRGTVTDITDRKKAEEVLRDSEQRLRNLAIRLQGMIEEERTRIARQIHDELGQALTGLKLDLSWLLKKTVGDSGEWAKSQLRSMTQSIDALIHIVRRIASDLRPGELDDLGLFAAIENQTREFQARTAIRCLANLPGADLAIDASVATAVFRIFQELLTNVARHAQATTVSVTLAVEGDLLTLIVHDNGRGIRAAEASDRRAIGLVGIRERATMFGGTVSIEGTPGKGTLACVRMPIVPARERRGAKDKAVH
jgi:PAS domain S-box-containing protein